MSNTVQKWGNSLGIGDNHILTVVPKKKKPTLEELLVQCKSEENRHDEIDFGSEDKELF